MRPWRWAGETPALRWQPRTGRDALLRVRAGQQVGPTKFKDFRNCMVALSLRSPYSGPQMDFK